MFSVLIREKGGDQQKLEFEKDEISIGRIQGNDIMLPKGNISKRHARIMVKDDKFVIVDLRSTNGTYVNGHKIASPMVISGDDKVYIGDFVIQLEDGVNGSQAEPAAPAPAAQWADEEQEPVQLAEEEGQDQVAPAGQQPYADALAPEEDPDTTLAPPHAEPEPVAARTFEDRVPAPSGRAAEEGGIDDLSEFEHYIRVLAMLHGRAGQAVFSGRDIESIDFASQWEELENAVYAVVDQAHKAGEVPGFLDVGGLTTDILYEYTALGPIEYFLADDRVHEIEVNAYNQIYVRRGGVRTLEWKSFSSAAAYNAVVDRLARSQGSDAETRAPLLRGRLEDGTTYRGVLAPLAPLGPSLVFRKPQRDVRSLKQLVEAGTLSEEMASWLEGRVARDRSTVLVAGRRGSGRTALLNALAWLIPEGERIAVLEESQELHIPQANVIRLDPAEGALDVVGELRPDRVLVGELTEPMVLPFLRLSAGRSDGCIAAVHARSGEELLDWLRAALAVEDGVSDQRVQDGLIGLAVEVIVHTERHEDAVRVTQVSEVTGHGPGGLRVTEVFRYDNGAHGVGTFLRVT
ncbi:MAG: hypothetical protein AMXMBFR64_31960 [Myxococcales bacterium]